MIVETLVAMEERKQAATIVQDISKQLSTDRWHSTQTVAYSLLAVSKFVGDNDAQRKFQFAYEVNGAAVNAGSDYSMVQVDVPVDGSNNRSVKITNKNDNILYARLILTGQPAIGEETATAENLNINVRYTDLKGNEIQPNNLPQGTDFVAEVSVRNPGTKGINYDEIALTQIFPSGWEIINSRMDNISGIDSSTPEYQDIRDDRVYTYFDLPKDKTQTYRIRLNAAYQGRYYLPGVNCSAMYDNEVQARNVGQWVEVVEVGSI